MTAEEEKDLLALSQEISAAENSPWEPACIARAFADPGAGELAFTMQAWINLERLQSPILLGRLPETAEAFIATAAVFGLDVSELDAQEIADVGAAMRRTIEEAFAMNLPMSPEQTGAAAEGFGAWLPVWTALVTECCLSPGAANALPVGQAYALLAGLRRAQGWQLLGTSYALRELNENAESGGEEADG